MAEIDRTMRLQPARPGYRRVRTLSAAVRVFVLQTLTAPPSSGKRSACARLPRSPRSLPRWMRPSKAVRIASAPGAQPQDLHRSAAPRQHWLPASAGAQARLGRASDTSILLEVRFRRARSGNGLCARSMPRSAAGPFPTPHQAMKASDDPNYNASDAPRKDPQQNKWNQQEAPPCHPEYPIAAAEHRAKHSRKTDTVASVGMITRIDLRNVSIHIKPRRVA
jgi:hypothetical protein